MEQPTTSIERRKKILLLILPLLFGITGGLIVYLNFFSGEYKTIKSTNINTSIVNKPADEIFSSKADLYSSTENKSIEEKNGKANFLNISDNLSTEKSTSTSEKKISNQSTLNVNLSSDEGEEANMRKRMINEVAPMATNQRASKPVTIPPQVNYDEVISTPVTQIKFPTKRTFKQLSNTSINQNSDSRNGDFNSFSYVKENKGISMDGSNQLQNEVKSSVASFEPVNCSAFVVKKTKINGNTVLIIELLEEMTLQNGKIIEKGTRIAGASTVGDNRVKVIFQSVNIKGKIEMIHFTAYDIDGMEGLEVKNARAQAGATDGLNNTVNAVTGVGSGLLGLPGQLAGGIFKSVAGTNRGGSVYIPAGYKLILRSGN